MVEEDSNWLVDEFLSSLGAMGAKRGLIGFYIDESSSKKNSEFVFICQGHNSHCFNSKGELLQYLPSYDHGLFYRDTSYKLRTSRKKVMRRQ